MKKILIVDDSEIILDVVTALIEQKYGKEYDLITATKIDQAIDIIEQNDVDLLFQDLNIETENDGLKVADYAKSQGIPVCLITADYDIKNVAEASKRKFDKFIFKPINSSDLSIAINKLI